MFLCQNQTSWKRSERPSLRTRIPHVARMESSFRQSPKNDRPELVFRFPPRDRIWFLEKRFWHENVLVSKSDVLKTKRAAIIANTNPPRGTHRFARRMTHEMPARTGTPHVAHIDSCGRKTHKNDRPELVFRFLPRDCIWFLEKGFWQENVLVLKSDTLKTKTNGHICEHECPTWHTWSRPSDRALKTTDRN